MRYLSALSFDLCFEDQHERRTSDSFSDHCAQPLGLFSGEVGAGEEQTALQVVTSPAEPDLNPNPLAFILGSLYFAPHGESQPEQPRTQQ